ncbi:MAG: AAA family ATPase [Oculatellaceae cyanobacterium Prado106]|jgi:chromosome partitioning protein|nr:AAA family ATPase [Oculatellaceae cyanobacterium Prado106]
MGVVIAFINQKGGCAKSTTAVHFAQWLIREQHKAILVDADAQRSSSIWLESLEDKIPCEVAQTSQELLDCIPKLATQYDQIVVDGPAGLSEATKAILIKADLAVIPCQPTGVDLRSASDAIRLIRQAQGVRKGAPKAAVFLSRAVKGTRLKDEALISLKDIGVPILDTVIHQRQAVADTFGQGATVWDLLGSAAAESAEEFDLLFQEILEMSGE